MMKKHSLGLLLALTCIAALGSSIAAFAAETRSFNMVTVEVNGAKLWLPSTIVVYKGDTVKINAVSKVPGENSIHGLTIKDFKVVEVADPKGKEIQFVADHEGIFPIQCHLHPTHIGSQLIVLKK